MIQPLFKMLVALSTSLLLFSCSSYIDYDEYKSESNIVYTKADTNYYTETGIKPTNTIRKLALVDTVFVDAHDSLNITLKRPTLDTILWNTQEQFEDKGYTVERIPTSILGDTLAMDSVAALFEGVVECVVGVEEYSYYTYWGGYYDWYWWYYPGYVTQTTYRTADVFIRLGDITSKPGTGGRMKMPWMLQVNDLVRSDGQNVVDTKIGSLIREGFSQAPYLEVK